MTRLFLAAALFLLGSCDQDEKRRKKECDDLDGDITSELARVNHCEVDYDCRHRYVSNRFGCGMLFHKSEDTGPATTLIEEYAHGSCWDGSVTLRLLDCALVSADDLTCQAGICTHGYAASAARGKAIRALVESRKKYDESDAKTDELSAAYDRCRDETFADSLVKGRESEPEYGYLFTFEADEGGLLKSCARQTRGCRDGVIPCDAQDSSSSNGP